MKMTKINNMRDLEYEISRLRKLSREKERAINADVDELVKNLDPIKLIGKGVKSMFSSATENKTLASTGASIIAGFLLEKVILRKANFITKYGLSHLVVNLVSNLVDEKWNPELFKKIKNLLKPNSLTDDKDPGHEHEI